MGYQYVAFGEVRDVGLALRLWTKTTCLGLMFIQRAIGLSIPIFKTMNVTKAETSLGVPGTGQPVHQTTTHIWDRILVAFCLQYILYVARHKSQPSEEIV